MPPAKKTATRKTAAKKKPPARSQKKKDETPEEEVPKGAYLTAAQQGMRDSLMVARLAQGWTWNEIAAEAGISKRAAERAVAARREAMPVQLSMDPAEVIERTFEGFQLFIADFERLAAAATEKEWLAVAVGAKKGANEAREKMLALLQATGRLPQDLGALRHLIDLRAIVSKMLDAVADFQQSVASGESPEEAARKVRRTFNELIGLEEERELPAAAAWRLPHPATDLRAVYTQEERSKELREELEQLYAMRDAPLTAHPPTRTRERPFGDCLLGDGPPGGWRDPGKPIRA